MNFNDSTFNNYPIEFKEINPSDFTTEISSEGEYIDRGNFIIENDNEKIIIEPDIETGYINEALQPHIDIHHKNTVVINASVGNGKSYSIIKTIKRYLEDESDQEYLIMVASPYTSLVKQYVNDIHTIGGVSIDQIYSYENIGRNNLTYTDKRVHVITCNTLLGNSGDNEFRNSREKRAYLNNLKSHCLSNNIKVVFIYDEIHASYYNFKEKYIFNLWRWKDVIHKNFVISATYNEASKIIIEYLAELTSKKIKIIESKRIRIPEKQSDLFLHFTPVHLLKADNLELNNLVDSKLQAGKKIDILCFSKKLSNEIYTGDLGAKLSENLGGIKLCVSELGRDNQRPESNALARNQFDETKCNIGTNFSTGVSIRKENHAFIIILPSRSTRGVFKNEYGIFSDGINAIIQALARQRLKGEIHVLLYPPDNFDFTSLSNSEMTQEQKEEFQNNYSSVKFYREPKEYVKYQSFNSQHILLKEFYDLLKSDVNDEIEHLNSIDRNGLPDLSYPSLSRFKLESSSKYFASKNPIFGKDISASLTYLALSNQLVNCKLKELYVKPKYYFRIGRLQGDLYNFYKNYINPHDHEYYLATKNHGNFSMFYYDIRDNLFGNFELNIKNNTSPDWKEIKSYRVKYFEIELIKFCYNMFYFRCFDEANSYDRSNYFIDSICIANRLDVESIPNDEDFQEFRDKISFFNLLEDFRQQIIAKIEVHNINNRSISFLPNAPGEYFYSDSNKAKINELEKLIDSDILLKNHIFNFKRNIELKNNNSDKLKSLYGMILNDFFESSSQRLSTGNRPRGIEISMVKDVSDGSGIDLINLPSMDDVATDEEKIEHFGSIEEYERIRCEMIELVRNL